MLRTLLAGALVLATAAPASIDTLVESGYSAVVLERLPADDIDAIVATMHQPVAECRPAAQTVAC